MHRMRFAVIALVAATSAMSVPCQAALADPPSVDPMPTIDQQVVRPGSAAGLTVFCSPAGRQSTMIATSPAFAGGQAALHRTYLAGMAWKFEGQARIAFDKDHGDLDAADHAYGGHAPHDYGRFVRQPVTGRCPGGGAWRTIITVDRHQAIPEDTWHRAQARATVLPRITRPGGRVTVRVRCPGSTGPGQRVITAGSRAFSHRTARLFHFRHGPDFGGRALVTRHRFVHRWWDVSGVCPGGAPWHATFSVVHDHNHQHQQGPGVDGLPGTGPQLGAGGTSGSSNSLEIAAGGLLAGSVLGAGWMVLRRYRASRVSGV